jgi:hypothetical protein
VGAQQNHVAQFGRPAVSPVADVVTLAVPRWAMTAREGTAAVAQLQRAAERCRDQAALASQVEKFALGAEDRGDEHAVAEGAGSLHHSLGSRLGNVGEMSEWPCDRTISEELHHSARLDFRKQRTDFGLGRPHNCEQR